MKKHEALTVATCAASSIATFGFGVWVSNMSTLTGLISPAPIGYFAASAILAGTAIFFFLTRSKT